MLTQRFIAVILVDDYHEFDAICNAFVGQDIGYRELGTYPLPNRSYRGYIGIIFDGTSPGDGEITDALNEAGIQDNEIDYAKY